MTVFIQTNALSIVLYDVYFNHHCATLMVVFHTFGDSHASREHSVWTFALPDPHKLSTHWLGPVLMHSFGTRGLPAALSSYGVVPNDWVCFCFGEIDCRCHVHKHVTDSYPYQAVIDELICRYMARIAETVATVPDIRVAVYMVPPPVQKDIVASNAAFPFLGSDEDRVAYTRYANAALQVACTLYNYAFVNAYDAYTTCDGFLEGSKSDGCNHCTFSAPIQDVVQRLL